MTSPSRQQPPPTPPPAAPSALRAWDSAQRVCFSSPPLEGGAFPAGDLPLGRLPTWVPGPASPPPSSAHRPPGPLARPRCSGSLAPCPQVFSDSPKSSLQDLEGFNSPRTPWGGCRHLGFADEDTEPQSASQKVNRALLEGEVTEGGCRIRRGCGSGEAGRSGEASGGCEGQGGSFSDAQPPGRGVLEARGHGEGPYVQGPARGRGAQGAEAA